MLLYLRRFSEAQRLPRRVQQCVRGQSNAFAYLQHAPSNALLLLNMKYVQASAVSGTTSKVATCSSSSTLCADNGYPGHDCTMPSTYEAKCTPDPTVPYITEISPTDATACPTNDAAAKLHLSGCIATSAGVSITITGVYFEQTGATSQQVTVAGHNCVPSAWTPTSIVCVPSAAARVGANLAVIVTAKNGEKTQQTETIGLKLLSYAPPAIVSASPELAGTTKGGVETTFTGTGFGPAVRSGHHHVSGLADALLDECGPRQRHRGQGDVASTDWRRKWKRSRRHPDGGAGLRTENPSFARDRPSRVPTHWPRS